MTDDFPASMDDLLYFTNRKMPDGMRIMAWVEKQDCPECGKGLMGKPIKDDGKVKIRATVYECPECGHEEPKKAYEESCTLEIRYNDGSQKDFKKTNVLYKRRTWNGMKAFVFENEFTGEKYGITKRMKLKKDKK